MTRGSLSITFGLIGVHRCVGSADTLLRQWALFDDLPRVIDSDDDIVGLNIPTGMPLIYELDDQLKPLKSEYLGDPEAVAKAQAAVVAQGRAG